VKDHVAYIHIKDGCWDNAKNTAIYSFAGDGHGDVRRILTSLLMRGYDGGISIEPHLAVVFHDATVKSDDDVRFNNYVEYGRRIEQMVKETRATIRVPAPSPDAA